MISYRVLLVFSMLLMACNLETIDGYEHLGTKAMESNLYLNVYSKSYGVYGGSDVKYFITDSISYNQYLGNCDDKQFFKVYVLEDKVVAEKYTRRNKNNKQPLLLNSNYYKLPH